jgi:hypothetical protein
MLVWESKIKMHLKKRNEMVWIGFVWLRIGFSGWLL